MPTSESFCGRNSALTVGSPGPGVATAEVLSGPACVTGAVAVGAGAWGADGVTAGAAPFGATAFGAGVFGKAVFGT